MTFFIRKAARSLLAFLEATAYFMYNHGAGRLPIYAVRHAYLRHVLGYRIGKGAAVHMGCFFTGRDISIHDRAVVNRNCYLDGRGGLSIGADASVSPECYLISLTHDPSDPGFGAIAAPLKIGNRVWLGARVMVLPGLQIGEGAIVGAGSVVTRDIPPFSISAGNPARRIGERASKLSYSLSYFPWFDTDVQAR